MKYGVGPGRRYCLHKGFMKGTVCPYFDVDTWVQHIGGYVLDTELSPFCKRLDLSLRFDGDNVKKECDDDIEI